MKNTIQRLSFASVALAAAMVSACGKPKITPPVSSRLELPEFSKESNFNLAEADKNSSFTGSLVFWDPALQSGQLTNLLQATRHYNETYTEFLKEFSAFAESDLSPLKAQLVTKAQLVESLKTKSSLRLRPLELMKGESWFESRLKVQVEQNPDLDLVQAKKVFAKYCDSKVFRFATSADLATLRFTERPTPSAVCEGFYKSQGYFAADAPDCAPSPEGKSFEACIWRQGLLKSSYAARYVAPGGLQKAEIAALVDDPRFIDILARRLPAGVTCKYFKSGSSATAASAITAETADVLINRTILLGGAKSAFDCNGVKANFTLSAAGISDDLEKASPSIVESSVELLKVTPSVPDWARFVPTQKSNGTESVPVAPDLVEFGVALTQNLQAFSEKNVSCQSSGIKTMNDALFNAPLVVDQGFDRTVCNEPTKSELPDIFAVDEELNTVVSELEGIKNAYALTSQKVCATTCTDSNATTALCQNSKAMTAKADAVSVPGVSLVLVTNFSVRTHKTLEGPILFKVSLNEVPFGYACLNSFEQGQKVNCPESVRAQAGVAATSSVLSVSSETPELDASFDPASRKLMLKRVLTLPDVESVFKDPNLKVRAEVVRDFPGRTLSFEMYPNLFEGEVPFLSGKALIKDGDTELYQGVASYLLNNSRQESLNAAYCSVSR